MKGAIRKIAAAGATNQVHSIDAPFRVEASQMEVNFLATPNGGRLIHIDIMEKRKEKQKTLTFLGGKAMKGDHIAPASAPAKCAWNGTVVCCLMYCRLWLFTLHHSRHTLQEQRQEQCDLLSWLCLLGK